MLNQGTPSESLPESTPNQSTGIAETVHESEFTPKRTICIPVDESKISIQTITWAIDNLIDPKNDQVILLNVREDIQTGILAVQSFYDQLRNELKQNSHNLLRSRAKMFILKNIHVRAVSLCGNPKIELEHKINELKPTMVLMGKRGMNTIQSLLLGSVSDHLLHHVKVPISILPSFN
ncbi:hypothetical protein BC833DRAFT_609817 [Globomyces pollinis-pini]|nr:hypothetical protein BC833DRAFT_609817 [Globomyces pollinis-pini]